jgi:2-dehydro-3-deoxyphosphogluconate aldolase/(4S)-4-hydroxy-2-oxoglutarate aldolase
MTTQAPSAAHVCDIINRHRIVPVIAIEKAEWALPLADALIAGGLPIVEITFRTAAAATVIKTMREARPDLLVGAGTVLTPDNLKAAFDAGAAFALAPGCNPTIVNLAAKIGLPFFPGVATPSEVEQALELGCQTLKFFPAQQLGGVAMLNALAGPYRHTGVKFIPTGGVTPANLPEYLGCNVVAAVGGTWLAKPEDFAAGKWADITQRCRDAMKVTMP